MADIKSPANPLFLREEDLRQGIELLFYAYRDFTTEADAMLLQYGFGRAHHRVIYFVGRNPGMPVAALLDILNITKQSLSRVLGQLVRQGFITQRPGPRDRRQRLLELTTQGAELERRLTEAQRALVARAYRAAGADAVDGFRKVLIGLINDEDRTKFQRPASSPRR
jgi:DNA-binding MarR family transcriptional regulator